MLRELGCANKGRMSTGKGKIGAKTTGVVDLSLLKSAAGLKKNKKERVTKNIIIFQYIGPQAI